MKLIKIFKIRREERIPVLCMLLVQIALHAFVISRHFELFSKTNQGHWNVFVKNFLISGFDPITYSVVTYWDTTYNVYRHPLLAFMVWPLSVLNTWLTELTGMNLVQILVALPLLFCAVYSFVFMYRIFKDIIQLGRFDATLLSVMTFSFAYVMISAVVPDHFSISMFLLVFSLYICGLKIQRKERLRIWQTVLLFLATAGVTLSNGVKIFIDALFTNGVRFFRPKYLILAVVLPSALLWGFARWEYRTFVLPKEKARHELRDKKNAEKKEKLYNAFTDTTSLKDSLEIKKAFDRKLNELAKAKYARDHKEPWNRNTGKPMAKGEFMNWTDGTTSRTATAIENLFGESIQLHKNFLLRDVLRNRPLLVPYSWFINYVVELVIVALFVWGIWCGRRSRFLWMALGGFAFDMLLHMGLGFGINEVYIMGAHWLFVIPIAMAFLVKAKDGTKTGKNLRLLLIWLATWLWVYNGKLFIGYLLN